MNSVPDPFTDLTPAECPLMPKALVERHNLLVGVLRSIRGSGVSRLVPVAEKVADNLRRIRARLMRDRFHVGFLGPTQLGKSTTFNNILGVVNDLNRRPSEQGDGAATTSVITRLRSRAEDPDEIDLHFTTEERLRYKRDQMCKAIDLDPNLTDEAIFDRLPDLEKKIQIGAKDAKTEDPRYLRRLLLSFRDHRAYLGSPARKGDYLQRFTYTTHSGPADQGSPWLLLEDVLIRFRTDTIHKELEMIDLPGLGAHVTIDTVISRERLEELDGALVFTHVVKRDDDVTDNVFAGLRKNFSGDFLGRVWLVFARCDGLGEDFLRGKGVDGVNGFDGIARSATQRSVPPDQVYLVSNHLSRYVQRGANGKLDPVAAAGALGFPAGTIPAGLDRHPELHPAYHALLDDGGIDRIRNLLRGEMIESVRKRAEDWIAGKLCQSAQALVKELEFDKRRRSEDMLKAVEPCLIAVQNQLEQLQFRNDHFEAPARKAREELLQQFGQRFIHSTANDNMRLQGIRERYLSDARALEIALGLQFELAVEEIFERTGTAFHGLSEVPIRGRANVQQAWEQVGEQDSKQPESWQGVQYPALVDRELLTGIRDDEAEAFVGKLYRALMEEKIQVSVQQAMHVLRWRIVQRLQELEKDLEAMTRVDPDEAGLGRLNHDELISNLRKLCPSI